MELAKQSFKPWQEARMLHVMSDAFQELVGDDYSFDSIDAPHFMPAGSTKSDSVQFCGTATLILGGAMFGALYATMIWMAL
jgi:hypothetical protein